MTPIYASDGSVYLALGVDVANVGSDTYTMLLAGNWRGSDGCGRTGSKTDVVEGELADSGVELKEQRQRLANATGGTEDGDLGRLHGIISIRRAIGSPPLMPHLQQKRRLLGRIVPGGQTPRSRGAGPERISALR
jgi:hypothetical protein